MISVTVQGVEGAVEMLSKIPDMVNDDAKKVVTKVAKAVRKEASIKTPVIRRHNGKSYRDRLAKSIRRRSYERGLTHVVDINLQKAPYGYAVNELDTFEMKTRWRKAKRAQHKRQGHFMEHAAEFGFDMLAEEVDSKGMMF